MATVMAGGTQQFQATVQNTTNTMVIWQVNGIAGGNPQSGTVSTTGLYTAPASVAMATQFTVTAVAVADSSKSASATITVNPLPPPVSVSVSPASATLAVAGKQQFTATVQNTTNTAVSWAVDGIAGGNSSVGMVDTTGLYAAPGSAGVHTVTATSAADTTKTANAAVSVLSISISPSATNVTPKGTRQFTATVSGTTNNGVTWSVDGIAGGNSSVGTINSSGLYTAPASTGQHQVMAAAVALPALSASASVAVNNSQPGSVAMLTYHNDDTRQGTNLNETKLNVSNVNSTHFEQVARYPVDGQIYAQPLYVPNLTINGVVHNVVFVATENNSIYAFDADGGSSTPLWNRQLGTPQANSDPEGIQPLLGITSTPVIDVSTGTIYILSEVSGRTFHLHALDILTGNEKFGGPVNVTGTVNGTGVDSNNGKITLEGGCYQRTGLALNPATNFIYLGFGHCPHGWLLAYDKTTLQQQAILNTTPDGAGGAIWNGGGTPAIDDDTGDVYTLTGVDQNDPVNTGYNDAFLRLRGHDLSILDYFIPSNNAYLSQTDDDLGSGDLILMPDNGSSHPHETIGQGKDGRLIVVNRDNMGGYQTTDQVIQEVQSGISATDNFFSTGAYWNGNYYVHAENDVLRAFHWDTGSGLLSTSPTSKGASQLGAHGATVSVSANGSSDGIVWEIDNSAHDIGTGPAILRAYDATNVGHELYDSTQSGTRDTAGAALKFTVPTVADGHVFVGTSNELDIYGLIQ